MPDDLLLNFNDSLSDALKAENPHKELFSMFLSLESEIYNRALSDAIGSVCDYPQSDLIVEKIRTLSL